MPSISTSDPEESETVARFEAFIDSYPDCLHRSCRIGHITGSAWIVNRTGDRVLLTHHRKLGRWLQPSGHSDGDPDTLEVALREAREESGLDVRELDEAVFDLDLHLVPARGGEPAPLPLRRPLPRPGDGRPVPGERGVLRLAWVPVDRVGVFTNQESVLRMARKWQARRGGEELLQVAARNQPDPGPGAREKMERANEPG